MTAFWNAGTAGRHAQVRPESLSIPTTQGDDTSSRFRRFRHVSVHSQTDSITPAEGRDNLHRRRREPV